ncbi:hypothetical protein M5D96_005031 [Drosophila gunungcola]|uniref:Uncharacterized protein n=1 Tax=Drosophila gunungcola TaxID=103775 RepID=A0A9P9YVK8_9MUSC|nr:hypothetical protein M5D96_005031 [Drosophila gunungcola]
MNFLATLFAVLAVHLMAAFPVFGHVPSQYPRASTDNGSKGGGYVISDFSAQRYGQRPTVHEYEYDSPRYNFRKN